MSRSGRRFDLRVTVEGTEDRFFTLNASTPVEAAITAYFRIADAPPLAVELTRRKLAGQALTTVRLTQHGSGQVIWVEVDDSGAADDETAPA